VMDDRIKTAFASAQEATKQILLLATGVTTLTITFFDKFATSANDWSRGLMAVAWVLYLISVGGGVWTLLALTGSLEPTGAASSWPAASIRSRNVVVPAAIQALGFFIGMLITVIAGILALAFPKPG
jgi:hypothetical protein